MAKKSDFVDLGDKIDKLTEFLTANAKAERKALEDEKKEKKDEKKEKEDEKKKDKSKRNTQELAKNTFGIVGLTASMFTLKGILGDLKGMNSTLSKSLIQSNVASQGSAKTMARFNDSSTGLQQQIATFGDAVVMGMTRFSDDSLKFSTQLKAQGIDNKAAMGLMRHNTQMLGISEEASLQLTDSLISTAIANGDSIGGLVSALNSMKEAMVGATVALGPNAAANMQQVVGMISQFNSEFHGAASEFVKGMLTGTEGYRKAASYGVVFGSNDSTAEFAEKVKTILEGVARDTAQMKGAGAVHPLEAYGQARGLSISDINLAQQLQGVDWNSSLKQGNTGDRQETLSDMSLEQAFANATRNAQEKGLSVMEGVASTINKVGEGADGYSLLIIAGLGTLAGINKDILTATRINSSTSLMGGGGLSKVAASLGKLVGPLAGIVTGVSKGMETGSWLEGLKRGAVSTLIWGAGAALAIPTGGASLAVAAVADIAAGDAISNMIPGGGKEKEVLRGKNDILRTDRLGTIADNTSASLRYNEEVSQHTKQQLEINRLRLEREKAEPITKISDLLAQALIVQTAQLAVGQESLEATQDTLGTIPPTEYGGFMSF